MWIGVCMRIPVKNCGISSQVVFHAPKQQNWGNFKGCCCTVQNLGWRESFQWLANIPRMCLLYASFGWGRGVIRFGLSTSQSQRKVTFRVSVSTSATAPMQTLKKKFEPDLDLWPFDLRVSACWDRDTDYRSTKFCVDSSSGFLFKALTDRQINRQMQPNALAHAGGYTAGVG